MTALHLAALPILYQPAHCDFIIATLINTTSHYYHLIQAGIYCQELYI